MDQAFRRKLKRLVKVFGLEKQFTFLNWIEETAPLFSSLDIFVSASHSESFGLAILEAMASQTAVVATATDGAKQLLRADKTGLLTPVKDTVRLAESVCKILENDQKREDLGKNGQNFVLNNFSLQKMVDRTEEIYLDAVSR